MVVDKEIFDHPLHIFLSEIRGHYLLLLAALEALATAHLLHARVLRLAGHHYPLVLRCQIHVETLMLLLLCNHITLIFDQNLSSPAHTHIQSCSSLFSTILG